MTEKILPSIDSSQVITKSNVFHIEQMQLTFSNGEHRTYERLYSSNRGAVLIVAMPSPNSFYLIREYAAGVHDYVLAFPKGLRDEGETLLEAADRELQEEVGFSAANLQEITTMTVVPSYWGAKITVVLAKDLTVSKLTGDEPEPIEVIEWSMDNIDKLLAQPDFHESRSIAALFYVKHWLQSN